jgi:hypothetical protein
MNDTAFWGPIVAGALAILGAFAAAIWRAAALMSTTSVGHTKTLALVEKAARDLEKEVGDHETRIRALEHRSKCPP